MPIKIYDAKRWFKYSYFLLLIIITILVLGSFIRTGINGYERAMFNDMIDGNAYKPFVYRVLVPSVVNLVKFFVPDQLELKINSKAVEKDNFFNKYSIRPFDFIIVLAIWFLSIIGFACVIINMSMYFYNYEKFSSYILSLLSVAGLPVFFKYYSYIYDFPQLFLFTLALYLMVSERWNYFLLLFLVVTINKETSILLTFIFIIHYKKKLASNLFSRILLLQLGIFSFIKLLITFLFLNNKGSFVEFHLSYNLLLSPYNLSQFISFILIGIGVFHNWKNKPEFLRDALSIIIPLLLLTFFWGLLDEYRDYYEVYPIILLLIFPSVRLIFNNTLSYIKPS